MTEAHYESPDFVSFSDGLIPIGWTTIGWVIDPVNGYGNSYSLFTRANNAYVTTTKACNYIEFYLRGFGTVNLYIDGFLWKKISVNNWEGEPQFWKKYMYDLPEGFHSFKWEFFSGIYVLHSCAGLDAILFKTNE